MDILQQITLSQDRISANGLCRTYLTNENDTVNTIKAFL